MAPSCKLELARFSALLRIQDGAECGNKIEMIITQENTGKSNEEETYILQMTEAIFVGWFTLEYMVRFAVSPHKVRGSGI